MCVYFVCVCVHTYAHTFFFHSPVNEHLGCFHVLAVINHATVYMGVYVLPRDNDFIFFRYIPRSRIV